MGDPAPLSAAEVARITSKAPRTDIGDFVLQKTSYKIKDPRKSLEFYTKVLGMILLRQWDVPSEQFTTYYMGYEKPENIPSDGIERSMWAMTRSSALQLIHKWGTEDLPEFHYSVTKKDNNIGYCDIGITVQDLVKACEPLEGMGVEFVKRPDEGFPGNAFILDPDGYTIELFSAKAIAEAFP